MYIRLPLQTFQSFDAASLNIIFVSSDFPAVSLKAFFMTRFIRQLHSVREYLHCSFQQCLCLEIVMREHNTTLSSNSSIHFFQTLTNREITFRLENLAFTLTLRKRGDFCLT